MASLTGEQYTATPPVIICPPAGSLTLPEQADGPCSRVYAYLIKSRGIRPETVRTLIRRGLLYQEAAHGNAVFVSADRTFYEIRGTVSGSHFHRVMSNPPDAYWIFTPSDNPPTAYYICESAIDAISLYELRREPAVYCGIGGVTNIRRIERIFRDAAEAHAEPVLAVDSDAAGQECRDRYPGTRSILPERKD